MWNNKLSRLNEPAFLLDLIEAFLLDLIKQAPLARIKQISDNRRQTIYGFMPASSFLSSSKSSGVAASV
jgi:hypothetical protein